MDTDYIVAETPRVQHVVVDRSVGGVVAAGQQGPAGATGPAGSGAGMPALTVVSGTTQAASAGNHYALSNASASTVTLPASPAAGDVVVITVGNGRTDNVIDRNGKEINGVAENMTIDAAYGSVWLRYIDGTLQWRTW